MDGYLFEIRQQIIPTPARVTEPHPGIVVDLGTSIEEHGIDYRPSTHNGSCIYTTCPSIKALLRNALVVTRILFRRRQAWNSSSSVLLVSGNPLARKERQGKEEVSVHVAYSMTRTVALHCHHSDRRRCGRSYMGYFGILTFIIVLRESVGNGEAAGASTDDHIIILWEQTRCVRYEGGSLVHLMRTAEGEAGQGQCPQTR